MSGRPSAVRLVRWCVALAATLMAAAALGPAGALAARGHVLSAQKIGTPGSGPGQLKEPVGVAVNEATGMVYVADRGNDRVQWFDAATGKVEGEIDGSGKLAVEEGKEAGDGGLPDEEKTGQFDEPEAVAVDNSCKDHHPVLTETSKPKTCKEEYPSNGDVYVVDSGHDVIDKYTASGQYVGQITPKALGVERADLAAKGFYGLAVESDGDVMVSVNTIQTKEATEAGVYRLSNAVHNVLLPTPGVPVGLTKAAESGVVEHGLAVAGGRVFLFQQRGGADLVTSWGLDGKLLAGGLVGEGEAKIEVPPVYEGYASVAGLASESCSGNLYVDEDNDAEYDGLIVGRFGGTGGSIESLSVPGGGGTGVAVDCLSGTASNVFVADFAQGVVDVYVPELPGPPSIEPGSGFASEASTEGAKVSGALNPRSEPGEPATTYTFEYGPCPAEGSCKGAAYGHSVSGSVPASYEPTPVSAVLGGLSADMRYHYRLSAHNSQKNGEQVYGKEELVFSTQPSFPGGLLDGRGWELVSPPDKHGAKLMPIYESGVVQASADGSALTYEATAATETGAVSDSNEEQVLSRRTSAGWESCDLGLPHEYVTGPPIGSGEEYVAFSEDLGTGVAQPFGRFSPLISPEASEDSPYMVGLSGSCAQRPDVRPLVSGCVEGGPPCARTVEEHADVLTGKPFGEEHECDTGVVPICGPWFEGANANLSAVVIGNNKLTGPAMLPALVEETSEGKKVPPGALYEWDGGQLSVVSVLGSGTPIGAKEGEELTLGTSFQSFVESLRGAVSEDGSRVVWSEKGGNHHLFVWDRATGRSAQADVVQGGKGEGKVEPIFQFATADGSKVFFTDSQMLTEDSGKVAVGHGDLYECEVLVEEAGPKCVLSDLTPKTKTGESAAVLGELIGASSDASTIYFVANGILAENAVKGDCEGGGAASEQRCNLYEWHDGTVELVAVLSGEDAADWGTQDGGEAPSLAHHVGRVTGGGEWLTFMSDRSLTGYDNRDVHSGRPDEEVYLYNSTSKGLVCVSCNPTGERPNGVESKYVANHHLVGGDNVWKEEVWLAANVPGWTPFRVGQAAYQSRYLDEDGRMFFNSSDNLVPGDTNGQEDVYEYEPAGVGSCQVGGEGYFPQDGGCLGLVSSGESPEESAFLDASENGNDVFFLTASKLSKRDTDTTLDVYDARVGGVPSEESKPVECQGDACQSPVTPPESLTPSSLTSNGVGNLLASPVPGAGAGTPKPKPETRQQKLGKALKGCRKDRAKARRKICEGKARAKYGAIAGKTKTRRRGR